ncbi:MAG TPA: trypsin-like peptidase domain-containing protein [Candidatus Limosilactobacillus merdipullorum]|uniref:Trypsin-like peptidase domain-containing protein n=1 Tax=Candidatus Limosilactobacillus merdipullorum TaxID=2838653 RepID=A0A9D1U2S8_9LACO|nr:trypsin-like peptidase domain-containing protein [Candidatus Limosilactobacillus merdipullorum]
MDNQGFQHKFWVKVVLVGLLAGLMGGGIGVLVVNAWQNHEQNTVTSVPRGSNKSGGTSVNKNKADLNNQATRAYGSVKNSVVSVLNKQRVQNSSSSLFSVFGDDSDSSSKSNSGKLETASEGSGVIYKKDGDSAYVVTNNHVVAGSNSLEVILSNGKKMQASIVGTDATTDLAVLKISSQNINSVASFGNSNDIAAGQDVLAIGSPMGSEYANTVTKGIISAKKRTLKVSSGNDSSADSSSSTTTNVIQTDAAINSGNSGGPLINMAGQVIGINSMKLSSNGEGSSVEGMGFAIPSNEVVQVINQLIKHGKVQRPTMGISMINLSNVTSDSQKNVLKLPSSVNTGVVVMSVSSDSDARNAGIKKYDVITKFGDSKIRSTGDLRSSLYRYKVGQEVKVTYYRGGSQHTTTVKLTQTASAAVENQQ